MTSYLDDIFTTSSQLQAEHPHDLVEMQATVTFSVTPGWLAPLPTSVLVWQLTFPITYQSPNRFSGPSGNASITLLPNPLVEITGAGVNGNFVPVVGTTPCVIYGVLDTTFVTIALCDQHIAFKEGP